MMDASGGGRPRGTGIGQHAGLPWRTGLAALSVLGLLAAMSIPPVPHAPQVSHAAPLAQAAQVTHTAPSGSDASCPPASPAAAGSATVGAPAWVRAIRGDGSATVVWCPPATGAGSVVSYTVTASGGQQVTARVPMDWAIVTGLANGTAETFTVTATTSGGTAGQAATSNSVTPAPPPPPDHVLLTGPSQTVSYDQSSLMIGGRRGFITAGGMP